MQIRNAAYLLRSYSRLVEKTPVVRNILIRVPDNRPKPLLLKRKDLLATRSWVLKELRHFRDDAELGSQSHGTRRYHIIQRRFPEGSSSVCLSDRRSLLEKLDKMCADIPYTPPRVCHMLFDMAASFDKPAIVEVSAGYGKATIYFAAAARARGGFVKSVDILERKWQGRSATDLLREADLLDVCEVTLREDARWYLLDLFDNKPGCWIDVAYIDAAHTIEVDAFVALALWTHLRPGGVLIFDDLDWVPGRHGDSDRSYSRPSVSHVRVLFNYIARLSEVADATEWGREEMGWTWGFIQKTGARDFDLHAVLLANR
jgi:predicted O-methyltransferase YrrM